MSKTKDLINELLVKVFNQILSIEEEVLRREGVLLSMTEVHVLEAINNSSNPTMTNVATKLRVTVGTLTTSVTTLVKKGYVLRERSEDDRRVVLLSLTKNALNVLKIHDDFHENMIEAAVKDLNLEEDKVLVKSLQGVNEYFKSKY